MAPGPAWWAATAREEWPAGLHETIDKLWHEEHGDRQTELVCIGQDLDPAAVEAALQACLLTKEEMASGEDGWRLLTDPFAKLRDQCDGDQCIHEHIHG